MHTICSALFLVLDCKRAHQTPITCTQEAGLGGTQAAAAACPAWPPPPARLPWGRLVASHCLVAAQGARAPEDEPAAVLAVLEGGDVSVCELAAAAGGGGQRQAAAAGGGQRQAAARLFGTAFQSQPRVTAARLRVIPIGRVPLQGLQVCGDRVQLEVIGHMPRLHAYECTLLDILEAEKSVLAEIVC